MPSLPELTIYLNQQDQERGRADRLSIQVLCHLRSGPICSCCHRASEAEINYSFTAGPHQWNDSDPCTVYSPSSSVSRVQDWAHFLSTAPAPRVTSEERSRAFGEIDGNEV